MDLEYLKKYNVLPKELKARINAPAVLGAMEKIEHVYGVSLAPLVMKLMVKEITTSELKDYFTVNERFDDTKADKIIAEIKANILSVVADYLGAEAVKIGQGEKAPAPAPAVRGSNFYFAPEDEEEIREMSKKTVVGESAPAPSLEADEKVGDIINLAEIDFGSEFLVDRFRKILRTYVKGIRTSMDTKITLKKPFDSGGLSFDEESADKVMAIADKVLGDSAPAPMAKPPLISLPEDAQAGGGKDKMNSLTNIGMRDVDYDFASLAKKKPAEAPKTGQELKIVNDASKKAAPISQVQVPISSIRTVPEPSGKVRMDDIKYVPLGGARSESQTMTPIDELRAVDLATFRRMGQQDPFRAAGKIKEKINILEEEDYNKKIEGIKAWRMSPMNRLYLEIGEQSISENKPVDVIMAERRFANKSYLTNLEFEAIMDLNKELRF